MINDKLKRKWHTAIGEEKYPYRFLWMGVRIIQEPQDIIQLQELIWQVKPDLVIATGIAHGGLHIFCASILAPLTPKKVRKVIGVDIDIRESNKQILNTHPLHSYLILFEGDSTDERIVNEIISIADRHEKIMVILDSNHTHNHVMAELKAYAPLVSMGSYCVVFDTEIEEMAPHLINPERPWGKGNNPKTAVYEYLKDNPGFMVDKSIDEKLIITAAPEGWLKRVW